MNNVKNHTNIQSKKITGPSEGLLNEIKCLLNERQKHWLTDNMHAHKTFSKKKLASF